jgi:uncharacterized protein (DUF433 family)
MRTIVRWRQSGLEPEQISARIGHISLGQVHAALAFYYANQEMMDCAMAQEQAEADRIEREHLGEQSSRPPK